MKKVFMEPELKVTKFAYEEMICSGIQAGPDPEVPDEGVDFEDWGR